MLQDKVEKTTQQEVGPGLYMGWYIGGLNTPVYIVGIGLWDTADVQDVRLMKE